MPTEIEPTAEELDAMVEEHYAHLSKNSDYEDALVQRAEQLKELLNSNIQVSKLLAYSVELADVYRQLDAENVKYID
jgi:hypothetical protein